MITFTILGEIVPYTRVGRERWTDRAKRYLGSRDAVRGQLAAQLPAGHRDSEAFASGEWAVSLSVCRCKKRGDLDNILKAVLDAANDVVFRDDAQVRALSAQVMDSHAAPGQDTAVLTVTAMAVE